MAEEKNTSAADLSNGHVTLKEDATEISSDLRCGYFGWRPNWLQTFNKPSWLIVCIMWFTFTQGFVVNGVKNVNTSTMERRYGLTSNQVAWISSSYDIGAGILAIIFGYLGTFMHKGRIIAIGAFIMGCGSFTWSLPHLIGGNYEIGARDTEICDLESNGTVCSDDVGSQQSYIAVFVLGQLMHSVGGAAIYTLSVPLIDENVRRKDSAWYIGLMLSCSVLGPGVGFIAGGLFLQVYVDTGRVDMNDIDIEPGDPRWVGAWWIGFVYSGFAAMTVAALTACFPRELPCAAEYRVERISEAHGGIGEAEAAEEGFGRKPKDLLISLKTMARNPVFILWSIVGIVEYMLIIGFATFLPKIIQFQFAQTASMSAVWAGLIVVPGATFGHLLGGLIPKWMNLRIKGLIWEGLIFATFAWLLVFQFLLKCDMLKIAGISVSYYNSSLDLDANNPDVYNPCNMNCSCTTASYDPVCGQNDVTYFTPCHAGCTRTNDSTGTEVYYDCSCIAMETELDPSVPDAEEGLCATECDVLPAFLVLFLLINISTFIPATAGQAATIRCVPDKQRSFAFGIQSTAIRFLGNVPGPLLFGAIFDSSCWLWQEECDIRGGCWIYNVDDVARGITLLGFIMKTISLVCVWLTLILYKPPPPSLINETNVDADNKEDVNKDLQKDICLKTKEDGDKVEKSISSTTAEESTDSDNKLGASDFYNNMGTGNSGFVLENSGIEVTKL